MKWLTKSEITKRAKKSYKEALLVSIEHHEQIAKATRREFFEAVGSGKVSISANHCGLCRRREAKGDCDDCGDCFLRFHSRRCGSDWKRIQEAIDAILVKNGYWPAVIKAEKNMIKVLKKELKKQGT